MKEGTYEDEEGVFNSVEDVRNLRDTLVAAGFCLHHDLEYVEVRDGEHNEADWARRADKILLFFFARYRSFGFLKKFLKF